MDNILSVVNNRKSAAKPRIEEGSTTKGDECSPVGL